MRPNMPVEREDLPSTIERSPEKVQEVYARALDSAHESYDSEERAHRTAWAAVKHVAEKKGDHWELKEDEGARPGPSDPQAARGGPAAREHPQRTYGGVDVNKPKAALLEDAREAGIEGRSHMSKEQLAEALRKHNERETARARARS